MPKSRRNAPPKEGYQQLDIAAINDRLDKRFDRLEEMLDTQFKEMTKTLADAISSEQQETRSSGSQKRRKTSEKQEAEPEKEDVDEESENEESDSKGEVGPTDSEGQPAEDHINKEKVSEELQGLTKEELYVAISTLLKEADFTKVTPADIRRQLGEQFGVDLTDRRKEVNQIIHDVAVKQHGGSP